MNVSARGSVSTNAAARGPGGNHPTLAGAHIDRSGEPSPLRWEGSEWANRLAPRPGGPSTDDLAFSFWFSHSSPRRRSRSPPRHHRPMTPSRTRPASRSTCRSNSTRPTRPIAATRSDRLRRLTRPVGRSLPRIRLVHASRRSERPVLRQRADDAGDRTGLPGDQLRLSEDGVRD